MNHQFRCHGCGRKFPHSPGSDLHCSDECRDKGEQVRRDAAFSLEKLGFAQSEHAPNLYEKDGVAISVEQFMKEQGIALEKHAKAVAQR